jgi:hypothetical protein
MIILIFQEYFPQIPQIRFYEFFFTLEQYGLESIKLRTTN